MHTPAEQNIADDVSRHHEQNQNLCPAATAQFFRVGVLAGSQGERPDTETIFSRAHRKRARCVKLQIIDYLRGHCARALRMRARTAVRRPSPFGGIGTSLAAIFLASGNWTVAIGMSAFSLSGFGHCGSPSWGNDWFRCQKNATGICRKIRWHPPGGKRGKLAPNPLRY